MAKTSMIERNNKRKRLAKKFKVRRTRLKAIAADRKLRMSHIALRDLGSQGLIPGMIKSSW